MCINIKVNRTDMSNHTESTILYACIHTQKYNFMCSWEKNRWGIKTPYNNTCQFMGNLTA